MIVKIVINTASTTVTASKLPGSFGSSHAHKLVSRPEAEKNAIEYCKETVEGCMLEVRLCIGGGEVSLMPMAVAASVIWPGPSHK